MASRGREVNMTASAYPKNKSGIAKHYDTPILLRACNTRKNLNYRNWFCIDLSCLKKWRCSKKCGLQREHTPTLNRMNFQLSPRVPGISLRVQFLGMLVPSDTPLAYHCRTEPPSSAHCRLETFIPNV